MAKTPKKGKITSASMTKALKNSLPPSGMSARDAGIMAPYGKKAMSKPRPPTK